MLKTCAVTAAILLVAATAHAQDRIKIGFLGTMSGAAGALGNDGLDGFKLAIAGKDGKLGGFTVDLVPEDDQLKPDVGVLGARKLIDREKVDLIVGTTFSNVLMAVAKPITEAGLFLISPNAGPSPLAGAQCNPNFFSVAFENGEIYAPMGKYLTDKQVKRVSLLAPNYQAGKDALVGFRNTFKGEIASETFTQLTQADYAAELAEIRSVKPDAVFVFYPGGLAVNFVKQYAQSGLKTTTPLYSGFALVDESVRPAQGEAALGLLTSGNWSPDLAVPANREFVERFRKAYNRTPAEYAMFAYDTARLINSALTAAKGVKNTDAFRAGLRAAKFESARGTFRFANNHFPIQDWLIREVVKAPDGTTTTLAARDKIFTARSDDFGKDCPMRW